MKAALVEISHFDLTYVLMGRGKITGSSPLEQFIEIRKKSTQEYNNANVKIVRRKITGSLLLEQFIEIIIEIRKKYIKEYNDAIIKIEVPVLD